MKKVNFSDLQNFSRIQSLVYYQFAHFMRGPSVTILLILCLNISKIYAQSVPDSSQKKSSFHLGPVVGILAYSTANYLVYRYADAPVRDYVQSHRSHSETIVSKTVTDFGLGRTQTIAWGATTATAWILNDTRLKKTSIVWLGSLLINSTITDGFKTTFQRHRPNTGDPYNTFDWRKGPGKNLSFVSAHTSNIFTTATVFSLNYRDVKWVPPVAYGLATLVGLSRIYDDAHWTSDVMAGAAVGYLSARLTYFLYNRVSKKLQFLPQPGIKGGGSISMVYNF